MSDLQSRDVPLKPGQIEFIETIARTHRLGEPAKAVRCLINYAREHPEKHDEIFAEVRCLDC
jgi:hypothetical protein